MKIRFSAFKRSFTAHQATDRICRLYEQCGFTLTFLAAPRRISCTGDRTPAREVFATRNLGS